MLALARARAAVFVAWSALFACESFVEVYDLGPDADGGRPPWISECGSDIANLQGPCSTSFELACSYVNQCEARCIARCVNSQWVHDCDECPAVACPESAPTHGAQCSELQRDGTCTYDSCEWDNEVIEAKCIGGSWTIASRLCASACTAVLGEDRIHPCEINTVCTRTSSCQGKDYCLSNPCVHEPFSCACAGSLCDSNEECVWARAGLVMCAPLSDAATVVAGEAAYVLDQDDGYVYFDYFEGPARVSIGGDEFSLLTHLGDLQGTLEIDVSGDDLFAADYFGGGVFALPKAGGAAAELLAGLDGPGEVATDATHVYVTVVNEGKLVRVPRMGGAIQVIASGLDTPTHMVLDATHAYWIHNDYDTSVMRVSKTGGTPEILSAGLVYPADIALDETHVYWTENEGMVKRLPKAGGPAEVVFQLTDNTVRPIAVDAAYVYVGLWSYPYGPAIVRAPKTGGEPEPLVAEGSVHDLVLDADHIYWTDLCAIRSLPK